MVALNDPLAARAHARAMEGSVADAMPILPPVADDLPDGVAAGDLLWEERIAAGGYASRRLARGSRVRLIDLEGDACASLQLFNAEMPTERLNIADTLKIQWNAYLGAGKFLLSDMGRVLMSIVADDAQTHDALCGASNAASNTRAYGDGSNAGPFPNARDRLMLGVAKHGLGRRDVHPCLTLFKGVKVAADGATLPELGPFAPGRTVTLRAEMDLILVVANCPHVLDTRPWSITPLRATAWRGPIAGDDDSIRNATPEGRRAFLNVDDYYRR
ncbi:urea carboxylase-associated family protein [Sphingomonas sp. PsM26]|nr:urea carboxylase-associated family protein [Sphingomonas sp. PsM26]